jgi:DNA-binding NarL/FixJ family response regulator
MARLKLLLVEDHELVGQGLKAMLGEHYDVVALVRDGREVLDAVGSTIPPSSCSTCRCRDAPGST